MIHVIRGPAGANKNAWVRDNHPGDLIADATLLWAAITQTPRGPDGKYPDRTLDGPTRAALYLKSTLILFAAREGLDLWATTSNSAPEAVERVRERVLDAGGEFGRVVTRDPGPEAVLERLRREDGSVSEECEKAIRRWYGRR